MSVRLERAMGVLGLGRLLGPRLCAAASVSLLALVGISDAHAEPPPGWRLGAHANISIDEAGETGWLLGVAVGAKHRLASILDLQLRVLYTYCGPQWHNLPEHNPSGIFADTSDGRHVLAEGTVRLRPLGPIFAGLGAQVGFRSLGYVETVWNAPGSTKGTDTLPVARGVFELGVDFGPREMIELGVRFALGYALGTGPVEDYSDGRNLDTELGFTLGVLLPMQEE